MSGFSDTKSSLLFPQGQVAYLNLGSHHDTQDPSSSTLKQDRQRARVFSFLLEDLLEILSPQGSEIHPWSS